MTILRTPVIIRFQADKEIGKKWLVNSFTYIKNMAEYLFSLLTRKKDRKMINMQLSGMA